MVVISVRGIYPHRREMIVLSLLGEFQAKHDKKQVCYACGFLPVRNRYRYRSRDRSRVGCWQREMMTFGPEGENREHIERFCLHL